MIQALLRIAALLVVAVLPFSGGSACAVDLAGQASVIDGDTIEIHGQRIRLHGIYAPESRQTCEEGGAQYRCGQRAAFALADWIGDRTVSCRQTDTDRYQRIVAVCVVAGEDIGAQGWALAYCEHSDDYAGNQADACEARRGIWRGAFAAPWDWRKDAAAPELATPIPAACCKVCKKGKACGDSCISRDKTCRKGPGCACDAN